MPSRFLGYYHRHFGNPRKSYIQCSLGNLRWQLSNFASCAGTQESKSPLQQAATCKPKHPRSSSQLVRQIHIAGTSRQQLQSQGVNSGGCDDSKRQANTTVTYGECNNRECLRAFPCSLGRDHQTHVVSRRGHRHNVSPHRNRLGKVVKASAGLPGCLRSLVGWQLTARE